MACAERAEDCLCDDRADLAGCGRDAVRGGAVTCGEAFAGDDECGGVGAWGMFSDASKLGVRRQGQGLPKLKKNWART